MENQDSEHPLSPAISCLNDAHEMWHQADKFYFDPNGFRREINSCIQTLRNVTFVVQSNKASIPNFSSWYDPWQGRLKADKVLRWLVDARNSIVKRGDLKIFSTLTSCIVASYFDLPKKIVEHSCSQPTEQLLARIKIEKLPQDVRENGFLLLERSWTVSELPEHEVLDALSHCYGTLVELVNSGGELINTRLNLECSPPSMMLPHEKRKLWVKLSNGERRAYSQSVQAVDSSKISHEILNRYKINNGVPRPSNSDIFSDAEYFFAHAKNVIVADGFHTHVVILIPADGVISVMKLNVDEYEDKYIVWRNVAAEALRQRAVKVISIGEAWRAKVSRGNSNVRVHELHNKEECLMLSAISIKNISIALSAKIIRAGKSITLGDTEREDGECMIFEPLRQLWGITPPTSPSPPPPPSSQKV